MENLTLLESLIQQDFGIKVESANYARALKHDSLTVDRRKQTFHWNSRDIHGDAYIYLVLVRGYSPVDAKEYIRKNNGTATFISEIHNEEEVIVYPKLVETFKYNLLSAPRDYFYKRTINDETISRYDLGYYNGFYMIPIKYNYVLKQFQMRRDVPTKQILNYYKTGCGYLYNSDILRYTNKIVLVEGVTSCLVLNQNGISAVSTNTGAEGFMTKWFGDFVNQDEITILYDNDSAGRLGAIRTAKILGETRCKIFTFDGESEHYDANDFFIEGGKASELLDLITTKGKYSFELERKDSSGRNGVRQRFNKASTIKCQF